jgi:hypothetical protein
MIPEAGLSFGARQHDRPRADQVVRHAGGVAMGRASGPLHVIGIARSTVGYDIEASKH